MVRSGYSGVAGEPWPMAHRCAGCWGLIENRRAQYVRPGGGAEQSGFSTTARYCARVPDASIIRPVPQRNRYMTKILALLSEAAEARRRGDLAAAMAAELAAVLVTRTLTAARPEMRQ